MKGCREKMEAGLLVLSAVNAAGVMPGRTALQKACYFANFRLGGTVFFFPHYFGPYSPEVARAATELVSSRLVRDEIDSGSLREPWVTNGGRLMTDWERHNLSTSRDGKRYLRSIRGEGRSQMERVERIVEALRTATELDPTALSLSAKVHFMVRTERATSWRRLKSKARQHGWEISDKQLRDALRTLSRAGFRVTIG